jgi:hypothetical protein
MTETQFEADTKKALAMSKIDAISSTRTIIVFKGNSSLRVPLLKNCKRSHVPKVLEDAGVPLAKWIFIYDAIVKEFIPKAEYFLNSLHLGKHSKAEEERFNIYELSVAMSNVLAKANFMLNSHGILALVVEEPIPREARAFEKYFRRIPEHAYWKANLQFALEFKGMNSFMS